MLYAVAITGKMTTNVAAETTDVEVVRKLFVRILPNIIVKMLICLSKNCQYV
jgi:hypothetical protein